MQQWNSMIFGLGTSGLLGGQATRPAQWRRHLTQQVRNSVSSSVRRCAVGPAAESIMSGLATDLRRGHECSDNHCLLWLLGRQTQHSFCQPSIRQLTPSCCGWSVHADRSLLVKAFITYVRPIVEYNSPVWSPNALKDINRIEAVQRRFTKRIPGMIVSLSDRITRG